MGCTLSVMSCMTCSCTDATDTSCCATPTLQVSTEVDAHLSYDAQVRREGLDLPHQPSLPALQLLLLALLQVEVAWLCR